MPFGTRIVGLPDGENILKICSFVLTECTNVTDTQTDRRGKNHPILMKFGIQQQIWNSVSVTRPNMKILKFKMADGRHILAIT